MDNSHATTVQLTGCKFELPGTMSFPCDGERLTLILRFDLKLLNAGLSYGDDERSLPHPVFL